MASSKLPSRAVIYVRISELTDATTSPERQLADCQAYAEGRDWEVSDTFEDLDISGTKDLSKRAGLASALDVVKRGDADVLIVAKLDRLARSLVTFSAVVADLQEHGAVLVSVAEGLDFGSPGGRMVANVLATFAQFESESIGARVASAKRHLSEQGKWPGGRRPFGWEPVEHESGKGYVLALHPEEGPILHKMAEAVLSGEPVNAVAADLNRRGITTAIGKDWVGETVRKALTKKAMTGRDGAERLLSDAEYARLQSRLKRGAPTARRYEGEPVLLSPDVLVCGRCGTEMRPASREGGTRIYRCAQRPAPGKKGCYLTAKMDAVDDVVASHLVDSFGHLGVSTVSEPEMIDPAAEERAELLERMSELEQDRYVRGLFSGDEGAARFQRIYADLEDRLGDLPEPYLDVMETGTTVPTGEGFDEAWKAADVDTRREWITSLVDHVVIDPGTGGRVFDPDRVTLVLPPDRPDL